MSPFFRRLLFLVRRSRHDADLRDEIETHRALRQAALERDGLAPEEARRASRRAMGNVTLAVEDAREAWAVRAIDQVWQDIRIAVRGLRKNPGFALVAIGTLALGIGANTALFSIFNSLVLRPLPVPRPGTPRGVHRWIVVTPPVRGDPRTRYRVVRRRIRVVHPELRPDGRRTLRARGRRLRQRRLLRRARCTSPARPDAHARR